MPKPLTSRDLALFDGLEPAPGSTGEKMATLKRANLYLWAVTALQMIELELPPALASEIRTARMRFTARLKRTEETDRRVILMAVTAGYWRADEISTHTRIPYDTVYRHLQALRKAGLIKRSKPDHDEPGKGGDRTSYLYKLVEKTNARN
jgi:DNA-binding transcriptional ArsR family regulator